MYVKKLTGFNGFHITGENNEYINYYKKIGFKCDPNVKELNLKAEWKTKTNNTCLKCVFFSLLKTELIAN